MDAVDVVGVVIMVCGAAFLFGLAFVDCVFWNGAVIRELKRRGW